MEPVKGTKHLSNVIKLTDAKKTRAQLREQANIFLARLDAGASAEDMQKIENWLAASNLHREVFQEMAKLWDEMTVLSSLSEVFPLQEYSAHAVRRKYVRSLATACALALVAIGSWLVLDRTGREIEDDLVYQHHVTAIGDR